MEIKRDQVNPDGWDFDKAIQIWKGSKKLDEKGREIGYIVGFNDNADGKQFAAWVQNGRRDVKTGEFVEFGVKQRARYFDNKTCATTWAWHTCRQRIAALK